MPTSEICIHHFCRCFFDTYIEVTKPRGVYVCGIMAWKCRSAYIDFTANITANTHVIALSHHYFFIFSLLSLHLMTSLSTRIDLSLMYFTSLFPCLIPCNLVVVFADVVSHAAKRAVFHDLRAAQCTRETMTRMRGKGE